MLKIIFFLLSFFYLFSSRAECSTIIYNIIVDNNKNLANIKLILSRKPKYNILYNNQSYILLDINNNISLIKGLPLKFSKKDIIKYIYAKVKNNKKTRLIVKINSPAKIFAITKHIGNKYNLILNIRSIFLIKKKNKLISKINSNKDINNSNQNKKQFNPFVFLIRRKNNIFPSDSIKIIEKNRIIVAIDAGHGGQDPGASGQNGLYEKDITLIIAQKLKELMDADPMFKPVLIRTGDYFISIMNRTELARKAHADLLISIHADAALNHAANGASVWLLSNRRANIEMINWIVHKKKQPKLIGEIGDLLAKNESDLYLRRAALDFQFDHSRRVGYAIALNILQKLQNITSLHKKLPVHASFGVLRAPDIPSLLVEIGFISNNKEEKLLRNKFFQQKIARSIYQGLRNYYLVNPFRLFQNYRTQILNRKLMIQKLNKRGKINLHQSNYLYPDRRVFSKI